MMDKKILILRLEGVIQSWDCTSKWDERSTEEGEIIVRESEVLDFFPIMDDFYPEETLFIYKALYDGLEKEIQEGDYLVCSIGFVNVEGEPSYRIVGDGLEYISADSQCEECDGTILGIIRFISDN